MTLLKMMMEDTIYTLVKTSYEEFSRIILSRVPDTVNIKNMHEIEILFAGQARCAEPLMSIHVIKPKN
jgi:hypothetical protein